MLSTFLLAASLAATPLTPHRDFQEIVVLGVVPGDDGHTVLLGDLSKRRFIPMGVGVTEALSIHTRLNGKRYARPLTHDLLDSMLGRFGGELVKVHIDALREGVFYGSVFIKDGDKVMRFDARPSDAIALALGAEKPIFIAGPVLDEASIQIPEDFGLEEGASGRERDDTKESARPPVYEL